MKINREALLKALSKAVKVAPKKNANMPILGAVYIDGPGQRICATDLAFYLDNPVEITDYSRVITVKEVQRREEAEWGACLDGVNEYEVETETEMVDIFCLPAMTCKKIVDSLDKDLKTVEITRSTYSDNFMHTPMVRIGNNFRDLGMFPADEFPVPLSADSDLVELDEDAGTTKVTRENLIRVLPAVTMEEVGFKLSVVHFSHEHGEVVATDGHRIHIVPTEVSGKTWDLPAAAAKVLAGFVGKDEDLSFTVGERNAVTKIDGATLTIRLSDGKFPDYKAVVGEPEHTVTIKREDAKPTLKQAAIMTSETYGGIRVSFNGQIDVEVINPDAGTYQKNQAIPCTGEVDPPIEVGMKLKYIADVINTAPKDDTEITVGVTDKSSGVHFQHGDFHGMVMPMRI